MIEANSIHSSYLNKVNKLLFLGSSCIYPKNASQPIREDSLLSGPLESTNEAYALAKISGVKLCEYIREEHGLDYFSLMPTNLYGPGDNFDLEASHVIPGMIRKIESAKDNKESSLKLLGTGRPLREFLYVEDLAEAVIFMLENYKGNDGLINVGSGSEISIKELANIIKFKTNYKGKIFFNKKYPNGVIKKNLNITRIKKLNWMPKFDLSKGLDVVLKELKI
jgi:GDP-L-fucose synthase